MYEVICIDWAEDNVIVECETREEAERIAENLDALALRCIARRKKESVCD
jgi:hypothetical protein